MSPALTIVKNAASNVIRGCASASASIVMPYFLVRSLSASNYGAWVLALQMSAYFSYLDFGLQTALARFVAQTRQSKDLSRRDQAVSSAGFLLLIMMLAATAGLALLVALAPALFRHAARQDIASLRLCMLLVGGSVVIGLPAAALTGILVGYEKNEIPAVAIGGCKLASGIVVVLAARYTQSIGLLAAVIGAFNLLSYAIQLLAVRHLLPELRVAKSLINPKVVREFVAYCGGLINFTVGTFLISGLDLAIVGHFRFPDVVAYSTAATLVMFLAGINGSVFNSLLAPAARYHSSGEKKRLGELVSYATRAAVFLNVLVGLPLVVLARPLLRVWVGDAYAASAAPILQVLVAANTLRLVFMPFTVAVLATGEQQRLILWPILEGSVNLSASIFGVMHWGSIGVASGTLVGGIFSLAWVYFYNLRQVEDICLDRTSFLRDSLLRPVCCFLPVAVLFPLFRQIPADFSWLPLTLSLGLSIMVIARWGRLGRPGAWAT